MIELSLNNHQTKKFWNEIYAAVDGEIMLLDKYLYEKYTITQRRWDSRLNLILSIEDEQYATWLILYL